MHAPDPDVAALLERALALAEEGEWEAVEAHLREGLEAHPDDPYVLCWLGMAERELGNEGLAYDRFKASLAARPTDPVLLATAGNALAAFDDPEAEAALRTAALTAPDLPQARWMYGAYLSREGLLDDAQRELDAAVALDPDDPVIHTELGVARALAGSLEAAAESFGRAVELDREDGWALVLLGLAAEEGGDLEEAARALDEGARLRPEDVEAQLLAALALAAGGWDDRALEMLERARLGAQGEEIGLVVGVEERIDEGPEAAGAFLRRTLAPSAFRVRLSVRP